MTGLAGLMAEGRPPEAPVARRAGHPVPWAAFAADVARLARALGPGTARWGLYTDDTYAFAVGLLAIWQVGGTAVLAPNGQPGTLRELVAATRGMVTDREDVPAGPAVIRPLREAGTAEWTWSHLDPAEVRLEISTSGTTGGQKPVAKTIANLATEVAGLERQWGHRLGDGEVFGTVSHQHIYGLLFRVLWPLHAGRRFRAETPLHPEEVLAPMAGAGRCTLVSTPTHLVRLATWPDLGRLAAGRGTIFSSGGPLDPETARRLGESLGEAPLEIFGSTETGGVAWRQQGASPASPAWTPLPDVRVETDPRDGVLVVRSSFVSAADGTLRMGDRAEILPDGRFVLGPRADRVVKVGDRRLVLPDMERRLRAHPFVARAALVPLAPAGTTRTTRVGGVIVPTTEGRVALDAAGRRAVSRALATWLQPFWDRPLQPRGWRFVLRLPEDAQGKVTVSALSALFERPWDPAVTAPEVLQDHRDAGVREQTLRVPRSLGCLDGHFPGFPVVPGVAQLAWVMEAARELRAERPRLVRLEALKFKHVLQPGDVFRLRVESHAGGERLAFRLWNDQALISSGHAVLAPPGRPE